MDYLFLTLFALIFHYVNTQSLVTDPKVNVKELRCLVCQKSMDELSKVINTIDPDRMVDIGGYQLDVDGNYKHKAVPQAKSELHLSETIDEICTKMDNHVRALWKSNGTLTLFTMLTESGQMNPYWDDVDIIQDDDLNQSLKYYCEGIMEEYEENIIKLFQKDISDIKTQLCYKETDICTSDKSINEEL